MMKEIKRTGYPSIIKRKITLENSILYEDLDLKVITNILNEVISENTYSTLDLIQLLKDNYQKDIKTTIKGIKDYSKVRFNCCYATRLLKERLKNIRIDAKIISYQSIGFSTSYGDSIIKEAHMALLIPTKRDCQIYYILLDPGLRIPEPICFYKKDKRTLITIDHDEIVIEKNNGDYSYSMEMKGYNRYFTDHSSYQCKEYFDIEFETINPLDILFPISYELLDGYRIINYSKNKKASASIKIMIIDSYLECIDCSSKVRIDFQELKSKSKNQLVKIIKPYAKKLHVDEEEIVENIKFMIEHKEEFINQVIDKKIVGEKLSKKEI